MTKIKISKLKVNELKTELNKRQIVATGKKSELANRLKEALNSSYIDINVLTKTNDKYLKISATRKQKYKYIDSVNQEVKYLKEKVAYLEKKIKKLLIVNKKCNNPSVSRTTVTKKSNEKQENIQKCNVEKDCKSVQCEINIRSADISIQDKTKNSRYLLKKCENNNNVNIIPSINKICNKTHKVLILSDSHGRSYADKLQCGLGNNFQVQCWFKPNACFEKVTESVIPLTKDFTKKDFVIVMMAGANNALKGKNIDKNSIENVMACTEFTNVLLVTIPMWHGRPVLNQLIYNLNLNLYNQSNEYDSVFLDVNSIISYKDFVRRGLHLNQRGKDTVSITHGARLSDTKKVNNLENNVEYTDIMVRKIKTKDIARLRKLRNGDKYRKKDKRECVEHEKRLENMKHFVNHLELNGEN
ncbi:hypothetical protein FQR65_LT05991 [Abscondita terminalis]|nr:hypothetical protein FQR65_LT05991 [Abscondita terminalis]